MRLAEVDWMSDGMRAGTSLEMLRELAFVLCKDGKRLRVLIQPSMGEGFLTVWLGTWGTCCRRNHKAQLTTA